MIIAHFNSIFCYILGVVATKTAIPPKWEALYAAHYAHAVVNLRDSAAVYEILIRKNDPNCARKGVKNAWTKRQEQVVAGELPIFRAVRDTLTRELANERASAHPIRTSVYEAGVLLPGLDGCRAARWKKLLETNAHSAVHSLAPICTEWAINMKERERERRKIRSRVFSALQLISAAP
jgi:hypothetical protein